jgi:thioredoxin reductase (NADPH)
MELNGTDIVVNGEFMTNIPGVFAAGDCTGGFLQIAKAVSDGTHAAKGINSWIKKNG